MSRGETTFHRLSSPKTTLTLLIALAGMFCFGLVVPQHLSGEAIGHSYSSSITQVVVGLELHRIERSWLTQLLAILLVLNLLAIGLHRALKAPTRAASPPGRSPSTSMEIALDPNIHRLDEWLRERLARANTVLEHRNRATATTGFRFEAAVLCLAGVAVLLAAVAVGARSQTGYITVVEGADDAARARFEATQVRADAELPWKAPFEMECSRSEDNTMRGPRRCRIVWDGKGHEATVRPGTDLEFLGLRLTLIGLERLPLSGSLDLEIAYRETELTRTTSSVGTPLDITLPEGRVTALLGGAQDAAPIGVLLGKVPSTAIESALQVTARPRTAMTFRVSGTQHILYAWIGAGLFVFGLIGLTILPAYRIALVRTNTAVTLHVDGYGVLSAPKRLGTRLTSAVAGATS